MAKGLDLAGYVVCADDGSLDEEAASALFLSDLRAHIEFEKVTSEGIHVQVMALFDEHQGENLHIPYIVSQSLLGMKADAKNWSLLEAKVKEYLQAAKAAGVLEITKGPNGGVRKLLSQPKAEPVSE